MCSLSVLAKYCVSCTKILRDLQFCEHCIFCKQIRVKFSKGSHTTLHALNYIHSDFCGPNFIQSICGTKYFISLVDGITRNFKTFPLKSKDGTFTTFKH